MRMRQLLRIRSDAVELRKQHQPPQCQIWLGVNHALARDALTGYRPLVHVIPECVFPGPIIGWASRGCQYRVIPARSTLPLRRLLPIPATQQPAAGPPRGGPAASHLAFFT